MEEYYEQNYLCPCGAVPGKNGVLCDNCEKQLLRRLQTGFDPDELLYLKEVYYLKP